jgi:hypothetical protein
MASLLGAANEMNVTLVCFSILMADVCVFYTTANLRPFHSLRMAG